jgi:hypothetical protein
VLRGNGNARRAYDSTYSWLRMQDRLINVYREVCAPLENPPAG